MLSIHSIVLLCLVGPLFAAIPNATNRIVGGKEANIADAPFTMQFRYSDIDYIACTGSLVAPQYVVTAAHCFNKVKYNEIKVVGGVSTLTESGIERKVIDMKMHPDFDGKTLNSDIAMLKLDKPISGVNIATIKLCSRQLREKDFLQVFGWGLTADKGEMSHQLKTARLPIVAPSECEERYTSKARNSLCAFVRGSESACNGDSGGPAVNRGELCGVVSFGRECGSSIEPSVFTDVYKVRSFITDFIKK